MGLAGWSNRPPNGLLAFCACLLVIACTTCGSDPPRAPLAQVDGTPGKLPDAGDADLADVAAETADATAQTDGA